MRAAAALILVAASSTGPSVAEEIRPGLYDVEVQIIIPHIETGDYDFTRQICIRPGEETPLGPLAPNTLLNCPRSLRPVDRGWEALTVCEGPNAGRSLGLYRITPEGFRGEVSLNMGGKNMTFTERQTGRLIGPC